MGTDDVRDALLDSARAAFHARGYVRTSMKGVAVAAGVACFGDRGAMASFRVFIVLRS